MSTKPFPAIPCGMKYKGKSYATYTVRTSWHPTGGRGGMDALFLPDVVRIDKVIAASPADAIETVRAAYPPPEYPTTWTTWGPKGGETVRTRGWEGLIADYFWRNLRPNPAQLPLFA